MFGPPRVYVAYASHRSDFFLISIFDFDIFFPVFLAFLYDHLPPSMPIGSALPGYVPPDSLPLPHIPPFAPIHLPPPHIST